VNPRYLEPPLRAAVCEQCHILGDHRIERLGRQTFDYRPGIATAAFFAVFDRVDKRGNKAVGHVQQMKLSRCFRESRGRLGCTSCHDPHQTPAPTEKAAYFRQQCLACHAREGCSLPKSTRMARSPDDNCIECHMPMSASSDIIHVATTDHRIARAPQAQPSEPAATASDPEPPLNLLNGDPLSHDELPSVRRELAMALASEVRGLPDAPSVRRIGSQALDLLEQAVRQQPNDLAALHSMAQALALTGRRREALELEKSVLLSAPAHEQALDDCVSYAISLNDIEAALAPARRAIAINPSSAVFHERLAHLNLERGEWAGALFESREALRLNPFLRFARMFVVQCQLRRKDVEHAEEEFATLIKLNPSQREFLSRWFAAQRRSHGL
jgi:predicted CXXCH cytochrome family protein